MSTILLLVWKPIVKAQFLKAALHSLNQISPTTLFMMMTQPVMVTEIEEVIIWEMTWYSHHGMKMPTGIMKHL